MTTTIAKPSVQSLFIEMAVVTTPISTGTGFVCQTSKGPVLVTNWHNLAGRSPGTKQPLSPTGALPDTVRIVHNQAGRLGQWVVRTEPVLASGRPRWIEHPTFAERVDAVALPLSDLNDVDLYPYEVAGGPDLALGPADTVSVVGFPFGMRAGGSLAVWATGFIASEPEIDLDSLPLLLIDCRSRPGQSGSAVIAYRNGGTVALRDGSTGIFGGPITKLLGIYSGRINDQSDLGLVWKSSAIQSILDSV